MLFDLKFYTVKGNTCIGLPLISLETTFNRFGVSFEWICTLKYFLANLYESWWSSPHYGAILANLPHMRALHWRVLKFSTCAILLLFCKIGEITPQLQKILAKYPHNLSVAKSKKKILNFDWCQLKNLKIKNKSIY